MCLDRGMTTRYIAGVKRESEMIAKITKAYIRHYSDNGQTTAYVDWLDSKGKPGRTGGPALWLRDDLDQRHAPDGEHMRALFARADREGVHISREVWPAWIGKSAA